MTTTTLHFHGDDEVHVWCADPSELERNGLIGPAHALLTAGELERLRRFHFDSDRLIFLATRVLVRQVLSRYESVAPDAWTFVANAQGRPEIGGPRSELRFNLSHTPGLVVCAVTREVDVGVDVESLARTKPIENFEHFLAPREAQALRLLTAAEQASRFFAYWTLKESYIKARGLGLAIPLDRFWFTIQANRPPRVEIDPQLLDSGDAWLFAQLRPTPQHLVAVCVRRRRRTEVNVVLRWHHFR
jgi:4'-phosphopantetheinyl transferase